MLQPVINGSVCFRTTLKVSNSLQFKICHSRVGVKRDMKEAT
jgi:hypothetical protein